MSLKVGFSLFGFDHVSRLIEPMKSPIDALRAGGPFSGVIELALELECFCVERLWATKGKQKKLNEFISIVNMSTHQPTAVRFQNIEDKNNPLIKLRCPLHSVASLTRHLS